MKSAEEIINSIPTFVEKILNELNAIGFQLNDKFIDHVCFRVQTEEEYKFYKNEFSKFGELLSEASISGRPICTFKLFEAVKVGNRLIPCMEIPAPKTSKLYAIGLEHLEIVIDESFDSLSSKFPNQNWDWAGAHKEKNPELAILLSDSLSAKFHHQSLEEVIRLEKMEEIL
ncbi:MAG: VOC family protein [Proteobacteria bacterium]|nr:VOC family protein [Pseudomonadota bacterium]